MSAVMDGRRRRAILILGMHRSGTSAMARVVSLLGAQLPAKLMATNEFNAPGYWEPQDVADLNDAFLAELGSAWNDPFGPTEFRAQKAVTADQVRRARSVIADNYAGTGDIVLKEPRIGFLHEIWRRALTDDGFEIAYIVMVRSPYEVAASLKTRDGMPLDSALLLWTAYMLGSEAASAGSTRAFIAYDTLLSDPLKTVERIGAVVGKAGRADASILAEIAAFVDPAHRHEVVEGSATVEGLEPVARLARYFDLITQDRIEDEKAPAEVAAWMAALEHTAGSLIRRAAAETFGKAGKLSALTRENTSLHEQFAALHERHEARVAQAEAQAARIVELDEHLNARIHQAETQHAQLAAQSTESAVREDKLAEHAAINACLTREIEETKAAYADLKAAETTLTALQVKSDHAATVLDAALEEQKAALAQAMSDLQTERTGRAETEAVLALARTDFSTVQEALAQTTRAAETLRIALAGSERETRSVRGDLDQAIQQLDQERQATAYTARALGAAQAEIAALVAASAEEAQSKDRLQQALSAKTDETVALNAEIGSLRAQLYASENRSAPALIAQLGRRLTRRRTHAPS